MWHSIDFSGVSAVSSDGGEGMISVASKSKLSITVKNTGEYDALNKWKGSVGARCTQRLRLRLGIPCNLSADLTSCLAPQQLPYSATTFE